jgi:predicted branched-subunit amino acid permease
MKRKILFVVSLGLILFFSWVNADLFGNSHIKVFSEIGKQGVHFAFLAITGLIGYINWRGREKWIQWLWIIVYATVFFAIAASILAIYLVFGNQLGSQLKIVIVTVRNGFTGPLPFLVFYMFLGIAKKLPGLTKNTNVPQ